MTEEELEAHFAQFISQFEAAVTAQNGRKALDVVIKSYNEFQDQKSDEYSEKTINFIPIASELLFGKRLSVRACHVHSAARQLRRQSKVRHRSQLRVLQHLSAGIAWAYVPR